MSLKEKGKQLYRMKGVLAVHGSDRKFVYQAVHMLNVGGYTEEWGSDEPRVSKLTFIGKLLDKEELQQGFEHCLSTPENIAARLAACGLGSLRFAIGDKVKCNTGQGWQTGSVVQLMYRDEFMPPGMVAPYQVQLDGGDLIYAPADEESLIQKA